jgi:hypothetical protein
MPRGAYVLAVLGLLIVTSCVLEDPYVDEVRSAGARDLPCPREEVHVCIQDARHSQYCAAGCGRDREYQCGLAGCSETLIDWCTCD